MKPPARRFIAGARCPSCGMQDTIYLLKADDGTESLACTRCDYQETKPNPPANSTGIWQPIKLPNPPD